MSKNSGECLKSFEKCYLSTTKCFENTHFIQTQTHQYCYSIGVLLFHLQKSFFSITFSYFISPKYTDKFLWLNNLANKLFKYAAKHTTSIANTVDKLGIKVVQRAKQTVCGWRNSVFAVVCVCVFATLPCCARVAKIFKNDYVGVDLFFWNWWNVINFGS